MTGVSAILSDLVLLSALIFISFVSGIGITTIGPGGIFLTISLYGLTSLSSGTIAGTVQVAFIATGLIGTLAYIRSGEINIENFALTALLCIGSIGGALFGAWVNGFVSRDVFGLLLGSLSAITGVLIVYRERKKLEPVLTLNANATSGRIGYGILGFVLGTFSGLLGVGGPVLAVPALVLIGVPMLAAVGIAQVQSIFIATFAAAGYFSQGTISFPLALIVGIPLLLGVMIGWKVAHYVNPNRLKVFLGIVLIIVAPYLAL